MLFEHYEKALGANGRFPVGAHSEWRLECRLNVSLVVSTWRARFGLQLGITSHNRRPGFTIGQLFGNADWMLKSFFIVVAPRSHIEGARYFWLNNYSEVMAGQRDWIFVLLVLLKRWSRQDFLPVDCRKKTSDIPMPTSHLTPTSFVLGGGLISILTWFLCVSAL